MKRNEKTLRCWMILTSCGVWWISYWLNLQTIQRFVAFCRSRIWIIPLLVLYILRIFKALRGFKIKMEPCNRVIGRNRLTLITPIVRVMCRWASIHLFVPINKNAIKPAFHKPQWTEIHPSQNTWRPNGSSEAICQDPLDLLAPQMAVTHRIPLSLFRDRGIPGNG